MLKATTYNLNLIKINNQAKLIAEQENKFHKKQKGMTREAFIRRWLANTQTRYTEQFMDEMRDDLDKVINSSKLQPTQTAFGVYTDSVRFDLSNENKLIAVFRTEEQANRFGRMMWGNMFYIEHIDSPHFA